MNFYFKQENKEVRYLYYNISSQELEYIVGTQYKQFPVRFFAKTYFCPFLNKELAYRAASERGNWKPNTNSIHIIRFLMLECDLINYIKGSIDNDRNRIVVGAKDLQTFNSKILGYLEKIETINFNDMLIN